MKNMLIKSIYVPNLGETIKDVTFSKWLVRNNSYVTVDQPICEIETEKANQELLAEFSGILIHHVSEGSEIKIGTLIASIQMDVNKASVSSSYDAEKEINSLSVRLTKEIDSNLKKIEDIRKETENQKIIINNQKKDIERLTSLEKKVLVFKRKLQDDLNIDFDIEKIDHLSLLILEHFKKIEQFDSYVREKKSLSEKWMDMIGKGMTSETIGEIIEYSKRNNLKNILIEIISISNNWNSIKKKENSGVVDFEYSDKVRNKVTNAIISLLHEFESQIT